VAKSAPGVAHFPFSTPNQNADQAVKKLQDPVALTGPWTTWQSCGLMNSEHTAQVSLVALS